MRRVMFALALLALILAGSAQAHVAPATGSETHRLQVRIAHDRGVVAAVDRQAREAGSAMYVEWHVWLTRQWHARDLIRAEAALAQLTWQVPAWFRAQALCVHSYEGSWADTGDPYWGGLQFADSTWARAGGSGHASDHSVNEQIYRAYVIYRQDGGSWSEWPNTAKMCGYL